MIVSNELLQINEEINILERISTESYDKLYDRMAFYSKKSGTLYRICDSETLPTNHIEFNGTVHKVIKIIRIVKGYSFFNIFGIDFDNIVEDFMNENTAVRKSWKKFKDEYLDRKTWVDDLKGIVQGYENIYDDELTEIKNDAMVFASESREDFYFDLDSKYFKYETSKIQDLSIVRGVQTFELSNLVFDEFENDFLFEEKLGGKFWSDDDNEF